METVASRTLDRALMPWLILSQTFPKVALAPLIVQELLRVIDEMVGEGRMAVILVEQHAHQILKLTRHAVVLERGRVAWQGASEALAADPALLDRLIGVNAG